MKPTPEGARPPTFPWPENCPRLPRELSNDDLFVWFTKATRGVDYDLDWSAEVPSPEERKRLDRLAEHFAALHEYGAEIVRRFGAKDPRVASAAKSIVAAADAGYPRGLLTRGERERFKRALSAGKLEIRATLQSRATPRSDGDVPPAEAGDAPHVTTSRHRTPLPPWVGHAWRLRKLAGKTQAEVASTLSDELHLHITQPMVSRALARLKTESPAGAGLDELADKAVGASAKRVQGDPQIMTGSERRDRRRVLPGPDKQVP